MGFLSMLVSVKMEVMVSEGYLRTVFGTKSNGFLIVVLSGEDGIRGDI